MAVAVASGERPIGVDVERDDPPRMRIARRVLVPEELARAHTWHDILKLLCAKEAAYKVLSHAEQVGLTFRRLHVDGRDTGVVHRDNDGAPIAHVAAFAAKGLVGALASSP